VFLADPAWKSVPTLGLSEEMAVVVETPGLQLKREVRN